MPTRQEVAVCAKRINRSVPTVWRWVRAGCKIEDPQSIEAFRIEMERRKTNIAKAQGRRGKKQKPSPAAQERDPGVYAPNNGELPVKRGAQFALQRLEIEESRSHERLQQALASGSQLEIEQAQMFWVRCVESLRKLDISIELGRRSAEEQVPKRLACEVAVAIADWLRISFMIFLSSESRTLMGIRDVGGWKEHAIRSFKGILDLTVRNSLKTQSPIPDWAAERVKESWHVAPEKEA